MYKLIKLRELCSAWLRILKSTRDQRSRDAVLWSEASPLTEGVRLYLRENSNHGEHLRRLARFALFVRDIHAGLGQREIGRVLLTIVYDNNLVTAQTLVRYLGTLGYGRWDDLIEIAWHATSKEASRALVCCLQEQFQQDIESVETGKLPSLLAKWMPSICATSARKRQKAVWLCRQFGMRPVDYRKNLSKVRASLNLIESRMPEKFPWRFDKERVPSDIDYRCIPAGALYRYQRRLYFDDWDNAWKGVCFYNSTAFLEKHLNSTNMTAVTLLKKLRYRLGNDFDPHHSEREMENRGETPETIIENVERIWKRIPDLAVHETLVPVFVAGKMFPNWASDRRDQPFDVAAGFSVQLAQRNSGLFHNIIGVVSKRGIRTLDISKFPNILDCFAYLSKLKQEVAIHDIYDFNLAERLRPWIMEVARSSREFPQVAVFSFPENHLSVCSCDLFSYIPKGDTSLAYTNVYQYEGGYNSVAHETHAVEDFLLYDDLEPDDLWHRLNSDRYTGFAPQ